MDLDNSLVMSDASGDQGFLPDVLAGCTPRDVEHVLGNAFRHGAIMPPFEYKDSDAKILIMNFMSGLKAAKDSALEQQYMPPGEVEPITEEQSWFLAERRKQFEQTDGRDQRLRQMYLSIEPEFSDADLQSLAPSTYGAFEAKPNSDNGSSLDLAANGPQDTQGS